MSICFFCPEYKKFSELSEYEAAMAPGKIVWTLLSMRYIKKSFPELDIFISDSLSESCEIILFHAVDRKKLLERLSDFSGKKLVCINADSNVINNFSDLIIFQNPTQKSNLPTLYIPHWPQAGIIKRDSIRESKIENLVYKGHIDNIQNEFKGDQFASDLGSRGIVFRPCYGDDDGSDKSLQWRDFSSADIQLALRRERLEGWDNKPPSKLINGWIAGVPSLLGPESAYQYYYKSNLDYIEVKSKGDVLEAIDYLKANPNCYLDMIAHGVERAEEFSIENISSQWVGAINKAAVLSDKRVDLINHLPKKIAYFLRKKITMYS